MNKFIAIMAAASTIAIAAPAFAQPGYGQPYNGQPYNGQQQNGYRGNGGYADGNVSARIDQLQLRLQAGVQNGSISRGEAMSLRRQLRQLSMMERQYAQGGLDGRERADLNRRLRDVRMAIRSADRNNQARWDGYDREDGYGREGYGQGQAYGQGGAYYGNDQAYQPQPRSGLGGIVDGLLGRDGLRIGQQAPTNLYGLQGIYADQFRDGNGAYYRTDGRQIYQIDARTRTVVRVYPMNR